MMYQLHDKRGFTLTETLVCFAIGSMLLALSLPSLRAKSQNEMYQAELEKLVLIFENAKTKSMATGLQQNVFYDSSTRVWTGENQKETATIPIDLEQSITTVNVQHSQEKIGVTFFPAGGNSGGKIEFQDKGSRHLIELNWLSGRITLEKYVLYP